MKQLFSLLLLVLSFGGYAQTNQQIDNQYAFAKVYGYLKYFYPGDEAAKIDWDKFAIYGAQKVENCKDATELKNTLNKLVGELMPGVKIIDQSENYKFDAALLTPNNLSGYELVSWQHLGVGLVKDIRSPYQSLRTNRNTVYKTDFKGFGTTSAEINAKQFVGKTFEFTGRAKMVNGSGDGHLWVRIDDVNHKIGFFDNMDDRPIKTKEWASFTIKGKVDDKAAAIYIGSFLSGLGTFIIDDLSLKIEGKEIYRADFQSESTDSSPKEMVVSSPRSTSTSEKYNFVIKEVDDNKHLVISSPLDAEKPQIINKKPFEQHAKLGEYIEKSIGSNLKLIAPIALYGTKDNTYPAVDTTKAALMLSEINDANYTLKGTELSFRLGNLINTWNIFQHFFPYFDIAKTDWNEDLKSSLKEAYQTQDGNGYNDLLKRLTAKLKDGHIGVRYTGSNLQYYPPITWKFAGDDLVITAVIDNSLNLKIGDVVKQINGEDINNYFAKVYEKISSGTKGYLKYRAETESLMGTKDSSFKLKIAGGKEFNLLRNIDPSAYYAKLPKQDTIKSLGNGITYLNISNAKMKIINDSLPLLQQSKAIICDLRGYPTDNNGFIEYLLKQDDTSKEWMQIPQIIYPDQENLAGYQKIGWGLKAKKPHLKAKIYFLIDGQAISYAESYMSFIEHYKLATIIGQPTAGTNGNVNSITLPGGYSMRFTGMKVLKHDGSQHHGIGIIPNIYVEQTAKGIKEGRDEILERAIAEALK